MKNGTILNNTYRVLEPIGSGGLGEIYLGYHENLQKYVVIKKIKEHCSGLLNNRIEVDILKNLHHTYLPQVYDFIQIDEGIFTVLEYISGHDLKYYIDLGYQFSEHQIVLWLKQLCQVLAYLHSRDPMIIHCDIKPGNIMITEEGNICLIDFNISLDGENNKDLVGLSSAYASPEQVKKAEYKMRYGSGEQIKMDARTDLYSVGAVFYYIMSGIRPAAGIDRISLKELEHPYSDALSNIIEKAMEVNPGKRFRNAQRMLEALEQQEKWESQYLKAWKRRIVFGAVSAGLIMILGCMITIGCRKVQTEKFLYAYDTYAELVNQWIEEIGDSIVPQDARDKKLAQEVVSEGIQFLNSNDFTKKLQNNPEQKAEILYRIGQALLYIEDYEQATEYLADASLYDSENEKIYRDLAIAQAKLGKVRRANRTLEQAMKYGLKKEEGFLLQAEIALAQADYESVWDYAACAAKSEDPDVISRAAAYLLESGEKLENTEECLSFLEKMKNQAGDASKFIWIRKQGELYFAKGYFEKATECYEDIFENGYVQLTDLYNLSASYIESGELKKAENLLLDMQKDYPEEYKIPMYLAYVYYRQQNGKGSNLRDYKVVERYFAKACELCEEQGKGWKEDTAMLQLEEILYQLEGRGWLE